MKTVPHALCWATAMIAAAIAAHFGRLDKGSATALLIVLPIAAWSALKGRKGCAAGREV
jgi:hypothetical protein